VFSTLLWKKKHLGEKAQGLLNEELGQQSRQFNGIEEQKWGR